MIEDYKSEVLAYYEEKRAIGALAANLIHPTPAKIKEEFLLLFHADCDVTDQKMLREFFAVPYDKDLSMYATRRCDPDKFRPLCKFLKENLNTRERNIELLAWLIDFQPRPFFQYWRQRAGKKAPLSGLSVSEQGIYESGVTALRHNQKGNEFRGVAQNSGITKLGVEKDIALIDPPDIKSSSFDRREKDLVLEYPSGVKISVPASDLSLVAKLVKL